MTYPLTPDDIANMSETQGMHAYTDAAVYISTPDLNNPDEYGQPGPGTETEIECAFVDTSASENWRAADVEQLDAEVYFISPPTPTKGGRVRVTHRFGVAVTNKSYEVIGVHNRGSFGFVCALKAVSI